MKIEFEEECVMCYGTGRGDDKGGCRSCHGTGYELTSLGQALVECLARLPAREAFAKAEKERRTEPK